MKKFQTRQRGDGAITLHIPEDIDCLIAEYTMLRELVRRSGIEIMDLELKRDDNGVLLRQIGRRLLAAVRKT